MNVLGCLEKSNVAWFGAFVLSFVIVLHCRQKTEEMASGIHRSLLSRLQNIRVTFANQGDTEIVLRELLGRVVNVAHNILIYEMGIN